MLGKPLVLTILGILLAGCSDPAPVTDPAEGPVGTDSEVDGNATAMPPLLSTRTSTPISWSGHTKEGAWVCSDQDGTGQCTAGQQVAPDGAHVNAFAYAGNLTLVDLNMTWQAAPGQAGLVFAAYGNTTAGRVLLTHVRGTSPLNLHMGADQLAGVVPDGILVLMAWPEGKTATEPSVYVDATQQPFLVDGRVETTTATTPPTASTASAP